MSGIQARSVVLLIVLAILTLSLRAAESFPTQVTPGGGIGDTIAGVAAHYPLTRVPLTGAAAVLSVATGAKYGYGHKWDNYSVFLIPSSNGRISAVEWMINVYTVDDLTTTTAIIMKQSLPTDCVTTGSSSNDTSATMTLSSEIVQALFPKSTGAILVTIHDVGVERVIAEVAK